MGTKKRDLKKREWEREGEIGRAREKENEMKVKRAWFKRETKEQSKRERGGQEKKERRKKEKEIQKRV